MILSDSVIRKILGTIDEWRDSGFAENDPGRWLDKICQMRRQMSSASQSYPAFWEQHGRNEMVEQACAIAIHPIKMQEFDAIEEGLKVEIEKELLGFYSNEGSDDELDL